MDFHSPDPAFTRSERARENFRLAAKLALGFVAFLWFVHLTNALTDVDPGAFGVRPRDAAGLVGIVLAPLLHADIAHLLSNTPPLAVLGTAMLYLYPSSAFKVLGGVWFGPGIAVWLFARGGSHIGASGLVYGLAAYVLVAGLLRRDRRAVAASLVVCFMYGALVWGVLPIRYGTSWETHLAAALIGVAMALVYRRSDLPPPKRYSWEEQQEAVETDESEQPAGDTGQRFVDRQIP